MELVFTLEHADAQLPQRAHDGDAGLDLRSVEEVLIPPGGRRLVRTGLRVAVPQGYAGLVVPRSGLALRHGVTVLNAPGLIDAPFRGELGVILHNTDPEREFAVHPGDRVAQLVVVELGSVTPTVAGELGVTARGAGGFGSTGVD